MKTTLTLLAIVSVLAALSGCGGSGNTDATYPPGVVQIKGAGSTFSSLLFKQWFAAYPKDHPNTAIAYDSVGSGEGVRRFIGQNIEEKEKVDFGASDGAMSDEELARVSSGAVLLPVTASSVVLAYNLPDFKGALKLSRKAYAGIFLGEIKSWDDPLIAESNPGAALPKLPIVTVVRKDSSGTTFAFTNHLSAISQTWHSRYGPLYVVDWPSSPMRANGNEGVAGRIKVSLGSIGYVSYGFAQKGELSMAVLQNQMGTFIEPNANSGTATLAAAQMPKNLRLFMPDPAGPNSYPIVTLSWVLLYKKYVDARKSETLRELFHWCLTDGQKYSHELGYDMLPPNVTEKALAALNNVTP